MIGQAACASAVPGRLWVGGGGLGGVWGELKEVDRHETGSLSWRDISAVVTHHLDLLEDVGIRILAKSHDFSPVGHRKGGSHTHTAPMTFAEELAARSFHKAQLEACQKQSVSSKSWTHTRPAMCPSPCA